MDGICTTVGIYPNPGYHTTLKDSAPLAPGPGPCQTASAPGQSLVPLDMLQKTNGPSQALLQGLLRLAVQTHCAHLYCMHSVEPTTILDANRAWIRRQSIICNLLRQPIYVGRLKKILASQPAVGRGVAGSPPVYATWFTKLLQYHLSAFLPLPCLGTRILIEKFFSSDSQRLPFLHIISMCSKGE